MSRKQLWSTIFVFLVTFALNVNAKDVYIVGILSPKNVSNTKKEWQATIDYLQETTGEKFELIPLIFKSFDKALKGGTMDFLLSNPAVFYEARKKYGSVPLASLIGMFDRKPLHGFGAVIFTRADSAIQTLSDLKGKKIAGVQKDALMGYRLQSHVLQEKGLESGKDYELYFTGNLPFVVKAVGAGAADAGFVRTGFLQWFAEKGEIDLAQFKVIEPDQDDFPLQHNGPIMPFWVFGAAKDTDPLLSKKVAAALMELEPSSHPNKMANVYGWEEPADLSPLGDVIDK